MDNQSYLDSIAVKGEQKVSPLSGIFTPLVIKIIAVAVILTITMLVVTSMLSSGNKELTVSYEKLSYVYSKFSSTGKTPLKDYKKKLRASELIEATTLFETSVANTNTQLKNIMPGLGVSDDYSSEAKSAIDSQLSAVTSTCESGYYNGNLDTAYATAMALEISQMIALQTEIRGKTNNNALATAIEESNADLEKIHELFKDYMNTH